LSEGLTQEHKIKEKILKMTSRRDFIKNNRKKIDEAIKRVCPDCSLNDEERERWISNDEGLYLWAKREGAYF
jgi:hypothetical protein